MVFSTRIFRVCLLGAIIAFADNAAAADPKFRPEKFFAGHARSSGLFQNTIGKQPHRFTTNCRGQMRGRTLFLDQRFRFDDGHRQERHWQIRRIDATHYLGWANDVVGEAYGEVAGADFHFSYTVALQPGNPLFNVRLNQTMTLHRDGIVENQATIRKLGVPLSRITEQFRSVD